VTAPRRRLLLPALLLLLVSACASGGSGAAPGAPHARRAGSARLITAEQLGSGSFRTAYDAVETLHPNWLKVRGGEVTDDEMVWVFLDDARLGGVEHLRNIPASSISSIQFIDGVDAGGRWGKGFENGVIYVRTHGS